MTVQINNQRWMAYPKNETRLHNEDKVRVVKELLRIKVLFIFT